MSKQRQVRKEKKPLCFLLFLAVIEPKVGVVNFSPGLRNNTVSLRIPAYGSA